MTSSVGNHWRIRAVRRQGERVTPLELFFDLVFVLAITQCTALMATQPDSQGIAKGMLALGIMWWSWVGYAWLTSVVDPEEGPVRLIFFGAMAALLVASLCIPRAFDELGLELAIAYGLVRVAHIGLFLVASRSDPELRRSVIGLAAGTVLSVGLLVVASSIHGVAQGALWAIALAIDMGGPFVFGSTGWQLVPGHFAERHGLIIIIALGESVVAIGAGSQADITGGVVVAAALGVALAAAMWWVYFDLAAIVGERRLTGTPEGKERNELARDAYSYLHFPMVAGIVLVALGLKKTLAHVDEPLARVPAAALVGGVALYLLALIAFRVRGIRTLNVARTIVALGLLAAAPLATELDATVTLAIVTGVFWALIAYEALHFADRRDRIRHGDAVI